MKEMLRIFKPFATPELGFPDQIRRTANLHHLAVSAPLTGHKPALRTLPRDVSPILRQNHLSYESQPWENTKRHMPHQQTIAPLFIWTCLAVASAAVSFAITGPVLAAEKPAPSFLQSGSNDLIRFQKGGVPTPEISQRAQSSTADKAKPMKRVMAPARTTATAAPSATAPAADSLSTVAPVQPPAPKEMAAPSPSAKIGVSRLQPEALVEAKPEKLDDDIDIRLVTICLSNPETAQGAKGFDIRRNGLPRYVAEVGETTCARFEPTRQMLFFWKAKEDGELALTLSSRLDLNDSDGTMVTLDWLRDH